MSMPDELIERAWVALKYALVFMALPALVLALLLAGLPASG